MATDEEARRRLNEEKIEQDRRREADDRASRDRIKKQIEERRDK